MNAFSDDYPRIKEVCMPSVAAPPLFLSLGLKTLVSWSNRGEMEAVVKKHQHKLRKVKDEMQHWEELQSHFISQFSNASSIIQRLQVTGDKRHYGSLRGVDGVQDAVLRKQLESLETILLSINKTMEDFRGIVLSLQKAVRDCRQLVKGESQLSAKQLNQRVGVKPSLSDCLDGLTILYEMHNAEYLLKTSVVSALLKIACKPSTNDLGALHQLLVDQPNIPSDEEISLSAWRAQFIFDIIFSEEIC